jgi:hypothetical protein
MTSAGADEFFEGLWYGDCGEFFLYAPSTQRYIEVNVAPNGAWWSCVFSAPRVRDLACSPPAISRTVDALDRGWQVGFSLELEEVFRCLGSVEDVRGNITLILGGCPDDDPPLGNLHSAAHLKEVDFHRPQDFVLLSDFED